MAGSKEEPRRGAVNGPKVDRYIPLIACVKCGTIRQGDREKCASRDSLWPDCGEKQGHPVMLVDHELLAVDTAIVVSPNPPGEGLK